MADNSKKSEKKKKKKKRSFFGSKEYVDAKKAYQKKLDMIK